MLLSDYIKTKEWRKKRLETFIKKWKKCVKCWSEKQIHVHHSTYERLWNETIKTDLFPLCKRCHNYFHKHYTWHFIQNTLDYLKEKWLPKEVQPTQIYTKYTLVKKVKRVRVKKTTYIKIKKPKSKNKRIKEPFQSTTYKATQWKEYKFNNFKL